MADVDGDLNETVRVSPVWAAARLQVIEIEELVGASGAYSALAGVVIAERLKLSPALAPTQLANVGLADAMRIADAIRRGLPVSTTETVDLSEDLSLQAAIAIIEKLKIAEQAAPGAVYNVSLLQTVRFAASLAQFFGAELDDLVTMSDDLLARALLGAGIVDSVELTAALTPKLLLNVTTDETVELDGEQAIRMLFAPVVDETVEMSLAFLEPNGSLTAWTMNVRNAAVTEYQNYPFNSFAKIRDRYVGAADDGLYELLGDDDAGEDIVATLRGGYLQFGGPQLSRVKEAYIAARGGGDFVLKIETGDGLTYLYGVSARDMRTTKIHMGKGMRARYFAYELTSTGQDFDLDTLEFVPLVVQRRV